MEDEKLNNRYCITEQEISFDPNRDQQLMSLFQSNSQYVHKNIDKQQFEMHLHLCSNNPEHYTFFGFIDLIEESVKNTVSTNFIVQQLSWIKLIKRDDYATAAKVIFSIPFDQPDRAVKLFHEIKLNVFQNAIIKHKMGNDRNSRLHWTKTKYSSYQYRYIVKGIALSLVKIDVKHADNSLQVTKILLQQIRGLQQNRFRWKRTWSDQSMRFIDSIILESQTPIKELSSIDKYHFNLRIKQRVTNIKIRVERLNKGSKLEPEQKINNQPVDSIFDHFMEDPDNDCVMDKNDKNQQIQQQFANENALRAMSNLPDHIKRDLGPLK